MNEFKTKEQAVAQMLGKLSGGYYEKDQLKVIFDLGYSSASILHNEIIKDLMGAMDKSREDQIQVILDVRTKMGKILNVISNG
jgi:hypothetical protein